jgi:hypothetical protein
MARQREFASGKKRAICQAPKKKSRTTKHKSGGALSSVNKSVPVDKRILQTLAEFHRLEIVEVPRLLVVRFCGYAHPNSKPFVAANKALKGNKHVAYPTGKTMTISQNGLEEPVTPFPNPPADNFDFHEWIKGVLEPNEAKMVDILADGSTLSGQEACTQMGYKHLNSKGFTGPKSTLRDVGILDAKEFKLSDFMFPFGRD